MQNTIIANNIPPILSGYIKVIDPTHERYNQYGKIDKRGRISTTINGQKTYVVIMQKDNRRLEFFNTQIRPTDTIQEAKKVTI